MGKGDSGCTCCPNKMHGAGLPAGMGMGISMLSGVGESASPVKCPSALPAFLLVEGGTCTEWVSEDPCWGTSYSHHATHANWQQMSVILYSRSSLLPITPFKGSNSLDMTICRFWAASQ